MWSSLLIALIAITFFIVIEVRGQPIHAFLLKALASYSFIAVFQVQSLSVTAPHWDGYLAFIQLGLVAGLIGDLVLALRPLRPSSEHDTIINAGISSFFVGHLFYLMAFTFHSPLLLGSMLGGLGMTMVMIWMGQLMKFKYGRTRYPSYLYTFILFTVLFQAIALMVTTQFSTMSLLLAAGVLLFALSDLVLAPIYYQPPKQWTWIVTNLVLYYGAQILIAVSVGFLI